MELEETLASSKSQQDAIELRAGVRQAPQLPDLSIPGEEYGDVVSPFAVPQKFTPRPSPDKVDLSDRLDLHSIRNPNLEDIFGNQTDASDDITVDNHDRLSRDLLSHKRNVIEIPVVHDNEKLQCVVDPSPIEPSHGEHLNVDTTEPFTPHEAFPSAVLSKQGSSVQTGLMSNLGTWGDKSVRGNSLFFFSC